MTRIKQTFLLIATLLLLPTSVWAEDTSQAQPDSEAWIPPDEFRERCEADLKASEDKVELFAASPCNAYFQGFMAGFLHGSYNGIGAAAEYIPKGELKESAMNQLAESFPKCPYKGYRKLDPPVTNRELIRAYLEFSSKFYDTEPNYSANLLYFFRELGECKNLRQP